MFLMKTKHRVEGNLLLLLLLLLQLLLGRRQWLWRQWLGGGREREGRS
jgi:hypothetical protein